MPASMLEALLPEFRTRGVEQLCINGHGETTARRGWHEVFEPLVGEFRISLTTNLARRLPDDEVAFLARIDTLILSLDTVDPDLLRRVRRAADLAVIVDNLRRIRAAAGPAAGPRFFLNAGVYDRSVMGLEALMRFAVDMGFAHVSFWSLLKYADIDDGLNVRTLAALSPPEQRRAVQAMDAAARVLAAHGIPYQFVGDFFEAFRRQVEQGDVPAAWSQRIFEPATAGLTKDCLDPWSYSAIKENGEVYPCCARAPIGRIDATHRYADILDGEPMRQLRWGLLNGELDEACRNCHNRPTIRVASFQRKYRHAFRTAPGQPGRVPVPPWRLKVAARPAWLAWCRRQLPRWPWLTRLRDAIDPYLH
jgi:MoaA/NifB/PqqE/SkfB family radical SAM enzyme